MKKILIALVIIFVGIQFIPVERTNPTVKSEIDAPANVKDILKRVCYNCHSNETEWVWYTKIAPASFLAAQDVRKGRRHLNFSEWNINKETKAKEAIWDVVREEEMPPWQYRIFHSESKLTQEEKNTLRNWATGK
jgi:uncharacterized membrane protein